MERRRFPRIDSNPHSQHRRPRLQWNYPEQALRPALVHTNQDGFPLRKVPHHHG